MAVVQDLKTALSASGIMDGRNEEVEDREISREEAIKILEGGAPFGEIYEPRWEAALALAREALKAEIAKQERCEFCKDGKTFWGAELILDNEGNWHSIRYCPNCGAKIGEVEEEKTPKLIDANEILKSEHQHYAPMADEYYVTVRDIENAPMVDAVPVVRCKDCESSITPQRDSDEVYCAKHGNWFKINGYCHLGRKKKDETDRRR